MSGTTYYLRAYAINNEGIGYGDELTFTTLMPVTDIDGNNNTGVTIGSQVWMVGNLKTTRHQNGDLIGTTIPATLNIGTENAPKYQWAYGGNEDNVAAYGRLYTWYSVTDNRNVCPTGWHLPFDSEWSTLTTYLGGEDYIGEILKEIGITHWPSPNFAATNKSGFTALPGGYREKSGNFDMIGNGGYWWSATEENATFAWYRSLIYNNMSIVFGNKDYGFSVRCIKD